MKVTRISVELDAASHEILKRLRGDLSPSAFIQLILKMVDSGAVSAPPAPRKKSKTRKKL